MDKINDFLNFIIQEEKYEESLKNKILGGIAGASLMMGNSDGLKAQDSKPSMSNVINENKKILVTIEIEDRFNNPIDLKELGLNKNDLSMSLNIENFEKPKELWSEIDGFLVSVKRKIKDHIESKLREKLRPHQIDNYVLNVYKNISFKLIIDYKITVLGKIKNKTTILTQSDIHVINNTKNIKSLPPVDLDNKKDGGNYSKISDIFYTILKNK